MTQTPNIKDIETINLEKLSNNEILSLLKKYNLQFGPVTDSTRVLYEKRLKKYFDEITTQKMDWNDVIRDEKNDTNLNKKRKLENQA